MSQIHWVSVIHPEFLPFVSQKYSVFDPLPLVVQFNVMLLAVTSEIAAGPGGLDRVDIVPRLTDVVSTPSPFLALTGFVG